MYKKASALTKVSSALEASVYYETPPKGLRDLGLLEHATQHDATLLKPFKGLTLKADHSNRHGIILICDGSGEEALMSDLGCTAKLDGRYWVTEDEEPCSIDLRLTSVCPTGSAP